MKNLSKKHLKQIYRRKMSDKRFILIPAAFFRAASNNRKDHDRMVAWRQSMRTTFAICLLVNKSNGGKRNEQS